MADQSFLGQLFQLGANTLIGLVSVIYALAIALIPFIASRIVKGDVGGTMLTLIATAYSAAKTVPAAASGAARRVQRGMNPGIRAVGRDRHPIRLHPAVTLNTTSPMGPDMPSAEVWEPLQEFKG